MLALNVIQKKKLVLTNATTEFKKTYDVCTEYVLDDETVLDKPEEGQRWNTVRFLVKFAIKKDDLVHADLKVALEIEEGLLVVVDLELKHIEQPDVELKQQGEIEFYNQITFDLVQMVQTDFANKQMKDAALAKLEIIDSSLTAQNNVIMKIEEKEQRKQLMSAI